MSEGRLAPVRETDRHAALVAGVAAAIVSAATFGVLYGVNVRPHLDDGGNSITRSFPFLVGVTVVFGLIVGGIEGAIAARAARRAADRFTPLSAFARKVFVYVAIANVALSAVAVSVTYAGSHRLLAELFSFVVAIVASAIGAAVFGWSHAVDWPHIPDYIFSNPPPSRRRTLQPQAASGVEAEMVDTTVTARNEIINEGRSRRNAANVDDEVWQEIQDLITGR